jgi:hypothetical protein
MSRARLAVFLSGMVMLSGALSAVAADRPVGWRHSVPDHALPFPRSERAQAVWAADACWHQCGAYTAWNLVTCLKHDTQGHCLKVTDAADRACQRDCRIWGGPLCRLNFPGTSRSFTRQPPGEVPAFL